MAWDQMRWEAWAQRMRDAGRTEGQKAVCSGYIPLGVGFCRKSLRRSEGCAGGSEEDTADDPLLTSCTPLWGVGKPNGRWSC